MFSGNRGLVFAAKIPTAKISITAPAVWAVGGLLKFLVSAHLIFRLRLYFGWICQHWRTIDDMIFLITLVLEFLEVLQISTI